MWTPEKVKAVMGRWCEVQCQDRLEIILMVSHHGRCVRGIALGSTDTTNILVDSPEHVTKIGPKLEIPVF